MSSSAAVRRDSERGDAAPFQIAARLAGRRIVRVEPVRGGGNNRLHRVVCADGTALALKSYLRDAADTRDRLGAEYGAARFLWQRGLRCLPEPLAADAADGQALYAWVEGASIAVPQPADIEATLQFARTLKRLADTDPAARRLPDAAEACRSGAELVLQVTRRLLRLAQVADGHPALDDLLRRRLRPLLDRYVAAATAGYAAAGRDFEAPLAAEHCTLSPSDFGFHNALRRPDGALAFLDFEYFGWDDPVKLVADFLWHPAMTLDADRAAQFRAGAVSVFGADSWFADRLALLQPLYGLRWAAIVLNEFLPERWRRRAFAGAVQRDAVLARQLAKADNFLSRLAAGRNPL